MTRRDCFLKRTLDIIGASIGLIMLWWLILVAFVVATINTQQWGVFSQKRVGKDGKLFKVFKIRTMRDFAYITTTVTQENDLRITRSGKFFRKTKIDELPQLANVLLGQMSFVGPRPDVPGFADQLNGEDRIILSIRPGITGPATLRFRGEERILAQQPNPEEYNRTVIFPEKVRLNREYIQHYSFANDMRYIAQTLFSE